jgi:hypothetical protein
MREAMKSEKVSIKLAADKAVSGVVSSPDNPETY